MLSQSSGNGTAPRCLPASEMSASQRNQTFDATIHQLNLVIVQVNALTQATAALKADTDNTQRVHAAQLDTLLRGYRALTAAQPRPFWHRLLWHTRFYGWAVMLVGR